MNESRLNLCQNIINHSDNSEATQELYTQTRKKKLSFTNNFQVVPSCK